MLDKSAKTPLTNVKSISSAAIYGNDNKVFSLSFNYNGNGSTVMLDKSAKTPLTNVKSIFAGRNYAIYGNDNKVLWFNRPSYNNEVALGITLTTDNNTPLTNVKSISTTSGGAFAAIYDNDNKVFIWGDTVHMAELLIQKVAQFSQAITFHLQM